MIDSLPRAVLEAADVSAISQLVLRERLSRDLGLWDQMRDCFHDDSVVRIGWINASGPEFVRRSKEMAERNVQACHRLGPIFVTLADDRSTSISRTTKRRYRPRCSRACPTLMQRSKARFLGWGQFLTVALNFLIIAWVLFLAITGINKLKKEEPPAPAPGPTAEVRLLTEIRDLLKR